jgi:hypothetical protein
LVRSLLIQVSPSIGDENQFPIPRRLQDTYVQPPGGLWTNTLQVNTGTYLYAYQPLGVPLGWYLANVTVDNEFLMTWPLFVGGIYPYQSLPPSKQGCMISVLLIIHRSPPQSLGEFACQYSFAAKLAWLLKHRRVITYFYIAPLARRRWVLCWSLGRCTRR